MFTERKITTAGIALLAVALLTFCILWYKNRPSANVPIVYSPKHMMESLWDNYKTNYLEKDTYRTIDKQGGNVTTSEGQSYTMLRAVYMDDQATFDGAYKWTKDILKHKDDNLFSWLFGKRADGSYGVIADKGGNNSASDADSDIALALIFANNRWHQDRYMQDALPLIKDIWDKEVVVIRGVPYLVANNVEKVSSKRVIVNPSYFSPYAYRIFSKIDTTHDWMKLVDSSYAVLDASTKSALDKKGSAVITPDWIVIDKTTGAISATGIANLTTNYSFDALRTPWRITLDYQWNAEPRAKAYLDTLSHFKDEWGKKGMISSSYSHDGAVVSGGEAPAMYGGVIGYFMVSDEKDAKNVYTRKLQYLFNPDTNAWKQQLSYYDDNWAWFGIGLYNHLITAL